MGTRAEATFMTDRTITVTAAGRASAPPDEVVLGFSASATEPAVTTARRSVAEQATELRRVLDGTGLPDDQIRTDRFRIKQQRPDRRERTDPDSLPYQATERITVALFDLDRLGDVLSAAVDEAGVEIDEVAFTFRAATRRALQREAIADAVGAAREKATAAATAEDLTVGDVRSMATDVGSHPRRTGAGRQLAFKGNESGSVESGPLDLQVSVEVEYELKER